MGRITDFYTEVLAAAVLVQTSVGSGWKYFCGTYDRINTSRCSFCRSLCCVVMIVCYLCRNVAPQSSLDRRRCMRLPDPHTWLRSDTVPADNDPPLKRQTRFTQIYEIRGCCEWSLCRLTVCGCQGFLYSLRSSACLLGQRYAVFN